jgi:hypothetical protein
VPGVGGGGGGGALLIASNTRITFGSGGLVAAQGGGFGSGAYNGGSGGAIRLVAPVVAGTGTLEVQGNGAGSGRIRIDTLDRTALNCNLQPQGVASLGSMMLVFPNPTPRLDIVAAAGTAIPVGSGPVFIQLPFGSTSNRTVTVQARDFNALVPIDVVLTPDNGISATYAATIDNQAANPAQVVVNVVVPVNVQTAVHAWTR